VFKVHPTAYYEGTQGE